MRNFLVQTDNYFYFLWLLTWIIISILNRKIYNYYNNDEVVNLGKPFRPEFNAHVLVFFTFHWTVSSDDPPNIQKLMKSLNVLSIVFAVLSIYCFLIWAYQF